MLERFIHKFNLLTHSNSHHKNGSKYHRRLSLSLWTGLHPVIPLRSPLFLSAPCERTGQVANKTRAFLMLKVQFRSFGARLLVYETSVLWG